MIDAFWEEKRLPESLLIEYKESWRAIRHNSASFSLDLAGSAGSGARTFFLMKTQIGGKM